MAESGLYSLISAECNGVSASEDDGLSAIEIRGVSSSLSCISCGCGVSTIEVGGLSSLSTCIGCAPPPPFVVFQPGFLSVGFLSDILTF